METLYAPYVGSEPATVTVNGHRVIVLSADPAALEENLPLLGGDTVVPVDGVGEDSTDDLIARLADAAHAYVVVTPTEVTVPQVI